MICECGRSPYSKSRYGPDMKFHIWARYGFHIWAISDADMGFISGPDKKLGRYNPDICQNQI